MQETDSAKWCFVSGKVCVLETSLLTHDFFERLVNLEKREEVFLSLSDSPLKDHFPHIERLYEFERILEERYLNEIVEIRSSSPDPAICDIFLIKYDFTNLKNYLKELLAEIPREAPLSAAAAGLGDRECERLWKGEGTGFDPIFKDAIDTVKEGLPELRTRPRDEALTLLPFTIDLALDNAYLTHLARTVSELDVPLMNEYFEDYFTIMGTEIILRAVANKCDMEQITETFLKGVMQKDYLRRLAKCPHEGWRKALLEALPTELVDEIFAGDTDTKNLFTQFERLTENHLLRKLRPARFVTFGPERIFGYLNGLTIETYNLRLTLGGKVNGVKTELIKERLRESYV